jgi:hypothetical protein
MDKLERYIEASTDINLPNQKYTKKLMKRSVRHLSSGHLRIYVQYIYIHAYTHLILISSLCCKILDWRSPESFRIGFLYLEYEKPLGTIFWISSLNTELYSKPRNNDFLVVSTFSIAVCWPCSSGLPSYVKGGVQGSFRRFYELLNGSGRESKWSGHCSSLF